MFGLSKRMWIVLGILVVVVVVFVIQSKNNPNSGSSNSGGTTSGSGQCQLKVVNADVLNIRSTPDGNGPVVGKLNSGQVTSATKTVQGGYRELNTNQWVSTQFVTPVSGDC